MSVLDSIGGPSKVIVITIFTVIIITDIAISCNITDSATGVSSKACLICLQGRPDNTK